MKKRRSNRKLFDKLIRQIAYKTHRIYPSRYQDIDDYVQVGYMALLQAEQQWGENRCGEFKPYAISIIAREIRRAAIESTCVVSSPLRIKALAAHIHSLLGMGYSELAIIKRLKIKPKEWEILRSMFSTSLSLSSHVDVSDESTYNYSVLDDILSIPSLNSEERQIIISRINKTLNGLNIPRTSLWKKMKIIRKKLSDCGYEHG